MARCKLQIREPGVLVYYERPNLGEEGEEDDEENYKKRMRQCYKTVDDICPPMKIGLKDFDDHPSDSTDEDYSENSDKRKRALAREERAAEKIGDSEVDDTPSNDWDESCTTRDEFPQEEEIEEIEETLTSYSSPYSHEGRYEMPSTTTEESTEELSSSSSYESDEPKRKKRRTPCRPRRKRYVWRDPEEMPRKDRIHSTY